MKAGHVRPSGGLAGRCITAGSAAFL